MRVESPLSCCERSSNNYCAMLDSGALFAAFLALFIIDSAHSQVSAPNCTASTFNASTTAYAWSYNSLGQSPCLVAAYLAAVCSNGTYLIPPLLSQHPSYDGPSGPDNNNTCLCSTVTYNLYSACEACQGGEPDYFSHWSNNCDTIAEPGTFTDSIPAQTRVPHWAYLDPTTNGSNLWNESLAQRVGNSPEVTSTFGLNVPSSTSNISLAGSTSNIPSSTSDTTASQTIPPESATGSGLISSPNRNPNSGAIVGVVVGVALIAGLVALFTIHRKRRHALSADYINARVVPYPIEIERLGLYDPWDLSTYPTRPSFSTTHLSDLGKQYLDSSSDLKPNRRLYHGLPDL